MHVLSFLALAATIAPAVMASPLEARQLSCPTPYMTHCADAKTKVYCEINNVPRVVEICAVRCKNVSTDGGHVGVCVTYPE